MVCRSSVAQVAWKVENIIPNDIGKPEVRRAENVNLRDPCGAWILGCPDYQKDLQVIFSISKDLEPSV